MSIYIFLVNSVQYTKYPNLHASGSLMSSQGFVFVIELTDHFNVWIRDLTAAGDHFTTGLYAHTWNLMEISFAQILFLMIPSDYNLIHRAFIVAWAILWLDRTILTELWLDPISSHAGATCVIQDVAYELTDPLWNGSTGHAIQIRLLLRLSENSNHLRCV